MLLTTWLPKTARGTRGLDLLGFDDEHLLRRPRLDFRILADHNVP
ncbi:hypothetical protein [Methylocystis echinoides]